jgi:ribosomal protein S4
LIYPIYRLDSFLSKLKFFITSFQARQAINNSIVLINNKSVSSNYFLKKKDIISFKTDTFFDFFFFRSIFKAFSHGQQFFSFCEFCPYTKTIVIIKSVDNLSDFDFLLLNLNYFDYKKFLTYISK